MATHGRICQAPEKDEVEKRELIEPLKRLEGSGWFGLTYRNLIISNESKITSLGGFGNPRENTKRGNRMLKSAIH